MLVQRNKHRMRRGVSGWSLDKWVTAMAGEAGEALNKLKKTWRLKDKIRGNKASEQDMDKLVQKIVEEACDTTCYAAYVCERTGRDFNDEMRKVYNRVSKRLGDPERL